MYSNNKYFALEYVIFLLLYQQPGWPDYQPGGLVET